MPRVIVIGDTSSAVRPRLVPDHEPLVDRILLRCHPASFPGQSSSLRVKSDWVVGPLQILEAAAHPSSYLSIIETVPEPIERETVLVDDFLLYRSGKLAIYYAPFDHINEGADVVLLGVTPGWTQMQLAFAAVRTALFNGASHSRALEEVKRAAAFGGTMRVNMTRMLNGIGLSTALGLRHADELFAEQSGRLQHPRQAPCQTASSFLEGSCSSSSARRCERRSENRTNSHARAPTPATIKSSSQPPRWASTGSFIRPPGW